jgi:hypothetical protein
MSRFFSSMTLALAFAWCSQSLDQAACFFLQLQHRRFFGSFGPVCSLVVWLSAAQNPQRSLPLQMRAV